MFPDLPSDLSSLSDEELQALVDELVAYGQSVDPQAATADDVTNLTRAAEAADSARALQTERAEQAAQRQADAAAALTRLTGQQAEQGDETGDGQIEPPAGDGADAPDAPDAGDGGQGAPGASEAPLATTLPAQGADAEPIAAGATTPPPARTAPRPTDLRAAAAHRPAAQAPRPPERREVTITAAADVPEIAAGSHLDGAAGIDMALQRRALSFGRSGGRAADGDSVMVASIHTDHLYPEERFLNERDGVSANTAKVEAATAPEAIVAAGGLCAPVAPYYDIQVLATADRPVRDALAQFAATRGGVTLIPPPKFADASGAIGVITAAADAAGGGGAVKPCLEVLCGSPVTYKVEAISSCLLFHNFTDRSYPEQRSAYTTLALGQHARVAETELLSAISACSTQVTAAKGFGIARQLIAQVSTAAAGYRNRNRMSMNTPLRFMAPAWVIEAMLADLVRGSGQETEFFSAARAEITQALANVNVNVTWYLDTGTGKGQLMGAQAAGGLVQFPLTAVWYLFAEGSFLFLDGGTLDFGLIRDSTLNASNKFQVFSESFEGVACVGVESLEVTSTVCPDGSYAPAGSAYTCP